MASQGHAWLQLGKVIGAASYQSKGMSCHPFIKYHYINQIYFQGLSRAIPNNTGLHVLDRCGRDLGIQSDPWGSYVAKKPAENSTDQTRHPKIHRT